MRKLLLFFIASTFIISCKDTKREEVKVDDVIETEVKYIDVDSNIALNDTIKIEHFSYRKLENEENNIELKISFSNESVKELAKLKDANLYILLYPLKEEQVSLLPAERIEFKFDNWSIYELNKLNSNEVLLKVNTKIFEYSKIELGLFELKSENRFGNMYTINNAYFQ